MPLPIILLHGFMQDARTWNSVVDAVPGGNVYAINYVSGAQGYSLPQLAESVHRSVMQICQENACDKVVLVGYSMGGRVAVEYARAFPQTLGALVLESAGLGCVDEAERAWFAERNNAWAQRMEQAESIQEVVDWWEKLPLFATQLEQPEEVQRTQRAMRLACDAHALAGQLRDGGVQTMPLQEDTVRMLASLHVPVRFLAGKRDERYLRIADVCQAAGIAVTRFDCGHNVHMERPSEFACVLNEARGME